MYRNVIEMFVFAKELSFAAIAKILHWMRRLAGIKLAHSLLSTRNINGIPANYIPILQPLFTHLLKKANLNIFFFAKRIYIIRCII
tara:strand:- start:1219 stop:1476 length:258 start_codon:yes stop_codon:yes gene_type:complete